VSEVSGQPVRLWHVVSLTTAVQAVMFLAVTMLTAIAPAIGQSLGIPEALIGYQISIVFGSASLFSLIAGTLIRRFGACRTAQFSLGFGLTGCIIALVPHVAALALASVFIGFGYSLTNPSASHLLGRFATGPRRNFIFSVKQTGVPIGGAAAGLIAPPLTVAFGWQAVPLVVGLILVTIGVILQTRRNGWDDDRDPAWRMTESPLAGLAMIWRDPPIRWLVGGSFFYTITQLSLLAFLVNMLVEDVGISLVTAGLVLSVTQVATVFGRLFWGWISDRLAQGGTLLAGIGCIAALGALVTTQVTPAWPMPALIVLFVLFGVAGVGWNGVYMAELARLSPQGRIGSTTGASLAITFAGVMVGPSVLATIHASLGSYTTTFGLLIFVSLAGAALSFASSVSARKKRLAPSE